MCHGESRPTHRAQGGSIVISASADAGAAVAVAAVVAAVGEEGKLWLLRLLLLLQLSFWLPKYSRNC